MRLAKLRIKNFRCFKDQEVLFDDYSCMVGANGSGKSTILMALNVFFRNTSAPSDVISLQDEDFHMKDTSAPIEITCVFSDLNEEARKDLKAYVRQNELAVTARATWDAATSRAEVKQVGIRKVMRDFVPYFDAVEKKAKADELKAIYSSIRESYKDLPPPAAMAAMQSALREYEEANPSLCEEVESGNQFYGWSKGANLLGKYIQWVYLPAVKDPSDEQDEQKNTALGSLLQRSIRSEVDFTEPLEKLRISVTEEYRQLIDEKNSVLDEIARKIENQLQSWAHPGARVELNWHFDDQKSVSVADPFARVKVGEGGFLGEIVRAGHGLQRSFLVSMLQVLADLEESDRPTLLLGFEEPELYQHPPQAKHLATLLESLSLSDTQVIATTHSPYFVSSKGYENVRLVTADPDTCVSSIHQFTFSQLSTDLAGALGDAPQQPSELMASVQQIMQPSQTELFFCKVPVLVEGPEDIAFLSVYMQKNALWSEFRKLGCHFIPCIGKTNMSRPLAIAKGLGMHPFVVFDGDCDKASGKANCQQQRDNGCILNLVGSDAAPIQDENIFSDNFVMWKTRILDEIRSHVGEDLWDTKEQEARDRYMLQSGVKRKNPVLVSATTELLLEENTDLSPLEQTVNALIKFANGK
ncbi:MAG: AAA family ATPase [Candidatus Thiodiazotropha sp.]